MTFAPAVRRVVGAGLAPVVSSGPKVFDVGGLDALIAALHDDGRTVLGPVVLDGVVALGPIATAHDLPAGCGDEQSPGHYRLRERGDDALFGYAVGPHSWKRWLLPPRERLWRAEPHERGFHLVPSPPAVTPLALLGVRPCELAALDRHDRVFLRDGAVNPGYAARRAAALVITVDCASPAATCFCASMGTGPAAGEGYDVALTEVLVDGHRFVARAGTEAGEALLGRVATRPASAADLAACARQHERAASAQTRAVERDALPAVLLRRVESSHWDDVAARCLACASCTLVCPTCFCHTIEDTTDLDSGGAERWRLWDSCFVGAFSYIHGGSIRTSTKARYRQWLTHKLGTWHEQFGVDGCVGCGRCITWCPAGIDITAEVATLRELDLAVSATREAR